MQIPFAHGPGIDFHQFHRVGLLLRQFLERGASGQFFLREPLVLFLFKRVQFVKQPRGGKSQRRAGLAGGPDVHQPMQCVFLLLDAQFITRRARARLRRRETGGADKESPARRRKAVSRAVIKPTVTRVRRKTASMISPCE